MVAQRRPRIGRGAVVVVFALTLVAPADADATFPGANGRIAFDVVDQNIDQFVSDIRPGERPRRLTRLSRACRGRDRVLWRDWSPHYSPDGNSIVYIHEDSCRGDYPYQQQIRRMRADGSANRLLFSRRFGDEGGELSASFSPDGQSLMVGISNGDKQRSLIISAWTGRVLAPGLRPTPTSSISTSALRWGPDSRIATAMQLSRPPYRTGLFIGTLDRPLRRFRQLTRALRHPLLASNDTDPDWHPNSRRLVFERQLECRNEDRCPIEDSSETLIEYTDIYTVNTNGKPRIRRLTRGGRFADPAFSPDGRRIVALRWPDLVVGTGRGGRWRVIARNGASNPDWQPVTATTPFP
jgi:Tol biopolymer transport system component